MEKTDNVHELNRHGSKSQIHHLTAKHHWASSLTPMNTGFIIFNIMVVRVEIRENVLSAYTVSAVVLSACQHSLK